MPDPRNMAPRQKALIMVAIMLGLFLAALDQTIVGTALPRIVTDLAGNNLYTWVVTVYLLTSTVTVPIYGKLSDVYGRRPLLLIGVSLFLLGSALSGLSQSMGELIIFRGIQGLGAGAIFPIALAVIGDLYSPAERGRYQGCSVRCSGSASSSDRSSVASSRTTSAGTGSSTSTFPSASWRCWSWPRSCPTPATPAACAFVTSTTSASACSPRPRSPCCSGSPTRG